MKMVIHSRLCTQLPVYHGIFMKHKKKSFSMFRGVYVQFRNFHSFKQKIQINGEALYPRWFSVAPMMGWTDNHYRTLARLMSKHAWLYTEMVVAETIVHQKDDLDRFLAFSVEQHPVVLQIGGSNLKNLAKAAELANFYSFDEINLNCGCPSDKVAGHGCFGASLMFNPKLVGDAMSTIAANSDIPVSVKCRIGVDYRDSYNELCDFISEVSSRSPTKHFIIHARKALLNGLSPAANRKVDAALGKGASGVMVGRAAYNNPWYTIGRVDGAIYGVPSHNLSRRQILEQYEVYADSICEKYGSKRVNVRQLVKILRLLLQAPEKAREVLGKGGLLPFKAT